MEVLMNAVLAQRKPVSEYLQHLNAAMKAFLEWADKNIRTRKDYEVRDKIF